MTMNRGEAENLLNEFEAAAKDISDVAANNAVYARREDIYTKAREALISSLTTAPMLEDETTEEQTFWRREWAGRAMQGLVAHHGIDGLTIEHIAQCFGVAGQMLAADRAQKAQA